MKKFQSIVIVRLDRITRSMINLLTLLQDFEFYGVTLVCTDQPIETGTAIGKLTIHIIGALAEYERELIHDRTMDGLAKAKRAGKLCHRPRKDKDDKLILDLYRTGVSISEIVLKTGLSESTIRRRIKREGVVCL
jgi:DNA invertase Pin-like site-specific DNA recombinase